MKLNELADRIGARIVTKDERTGRIEIDRYAHGDRVSDLLNEATESALLVTDLSNALLPRVAELMDVPAVCLLNGAVPAPEVVDAAIANGVALLVSPFDVHETCHRLQQGFNARPNAAR